MSGFEAQRIGSGRSKGSFPCRSSQNQMTLRKKKEPAFVRFVFCEVLMTSRRGNVDTSIGP